MARPKARARPLGAVSSRVRSRRARPPALESALALALALLCGGAAARPLPHEDAGVALPAPALEYPALVVECGAGDAGEAAASTAECLGAAVGGAFAQQVVAHVASADARALAAYAATPAGREAVDMLESAFPEALRDEMGALARAAGVRYEDVLLLNLRPELALLADQQAAPNKSAPPLQRVPDCSDAIVTSASDGSYSTALGHNEDNVRSIVNGSYYLTLRVSGKERWTAFCYGGELATGAFGWSAAGGGFGMTLNALFPRGARREGVPRIVAARGALEAPSAEAAIETLVGADLAAGFNMNVVDFATGGVATIERGPVDAASVLRLPRQGSAKDSYVHFNNYRRVAVDAFPDPSSEARQAAAERFVAALGRNMVRSCENKLKLRKGDVLA